MPKVKIRGCTFHLRKGFRTNLGHYGHIKTLKRDGDFKHSYLCLVALAYAKEEDVVALFHALIAEHDFHPDLLPYAKNYFKMTWVESAPGVPAKYKLSDWNQHERYFYIFVFLTVFQTNNLSF